MSHAGRPVEPFKIDNLYEADNYLQELFKEPKYLSMAEVNERAQKYINDKDLRIYFVEKGRKMLDELTVNGKSPRK